jgi:hypothetical protein
MATFKVIIIHHTIGFTNVSYLGALVVAASLRDGGTSKKIAVIVPADEAHRLLPQTITQLEVLSLIILYFQLLISSAGLF